MNELNDIALSINHLLNDIKAEVVIADLIENGIDPNDIIFSPDSTFNRTYKHDITHAEVSKLNNFQNILRVHTSRDGIYDSLPEGLFHNISPESVTSGKEMATNSKKLKMEEKMIRNFFLPFENEIFTQLINLEIQERKLISQYSEDLFDNIFPEFWKIDKSLPRKWVSRLVIFLHYAHQFITDYETVAKCLEVIIEEKVKIRIKSAGSWPSGPEALTKDSTCFALGDANLGEDTICGSLDFSTDVSLEFIIGPVKNTPLNAFYENGQMTKFLQCFFGFFTPVEVDVETTILIDKNDEGFALSHSGEGVSLGYNTII